MCWLSETLRKICNAGVVVLLERMGMNFGTHPLTVEVYRARTAADLRDIPITAHGYKCAVCKRAWNKGTAGRKKAANGGWRCPDCVAISKPETTTEHGPGASLK